MAGKKCYRKGYRGCRRPSNALTGWVPLPYLTPAQIANLAAWYIASATYCFQDAAATVPCTNGTKVYTWLDASGNGNTLVQATSGNRPTFVTGVQNGLPAVEFVKGNSTYMTVAFTLNQPITQVPILGGVPTSGEQWLVDGHGSGTNEDQLIVNATSTQWSQNGGATLNSTISNDGAWHMVAAVYNSTSSFLVVDGTQGATGNAGSQNPAGVSVGSDAPVLNYGTMNLGELLVYKSALTTSQIALLRAYSQGKWATP